MVSGCPAIFDDDIPPFEKTCFIQAADEPRRIGRVFARRGGAKKADDRHRRLLLCMCRKGPRDCCDAKRDNEFSPPNVD